LSSLVIERHNEGELVISDEVLDVGGGPGSGEDVLAFVELLEEDEPFLLGRPVFSDSGAIGVDEDDIIVGSSD